MVHSILNAAVDYVAFLVKDCERVLDRRLSDGEVRDLVKDQTCWAGDVCDRNATRFLIFRRAQA